jgi:acyl-CoA thioester hydrolase
MSDTSPTTHPWQVEIAFKVQTYDIDFAGIVSNIVYIRWLEDLRLKVLEENYPILNMLDDGYAPFLARTDISYKRGITMYDKPVGVVWVSSLGRAKWTFHGEFLVDGQQVATATQDCGFMDLATMKVIPIPQAFRALYAQVAGSA